VQRAVQGQQSYESEQKRTLRDARALRLLGKFWIEAMLFNPA
jgi:hypothetical protein